MTQMTAQSLLTADAGVGRWNLDPSATTVALTHKTMWGAVTVRGSFTDVSGTGTVAAGGALSGALHIAAASVDTKNAKRDAHLRSADFLDVAAFPEITVDVTSASLTVDGIELQAGLTVKGIREPLVLPARIIDAVGDTVTVSVETEIDRARFGLTWNKMGMMKGGAAVTVRATFTRTP